MEAYLLDADSFIMVVKVIAEAIKEAPQQIAQVLVDSWATASLKAVALGKEVSDDQVDDTIA